MNIRSAARVNVPASATVGSHLYPSFTKLGVSNRNQLSALAGSPSPG
jgi:hypothetical protein